MSTTAPRFTPLLICQIILWAVVAAKIFWVGRGILSSGNTQPMMLFLLSVLILALATLCFGTGRRPVGLALSLAGVAIAFFAGQTTGVAPGVDASRYEEQFRNHIADYLFLCAALASFILTRRASIAAALPAADATPAV